MGTETTNNAGNRITAPNLHVAIASEKQASLSKIHNGVLPAKVSAVIACRCRRAGWQKSVSVSYKCHVNSAKSYEKANKNRKEKENLTNPI